MQFPNVGMQPKVSFEEFCVEMRKGLEKRMHEQIKSFNDASFCTSILKDFNLSIPIQRE